MALRLASKINRHFITKNFGKHLSSNSESISVLSGAAQKSKLLEGIPAPNPLDDVRYQVCRPRTSSLLRSNYGHIEEESHFAQKCENRRLQPAQLPEFFKPNVDLNSVAAPRAERQTELLLKMPKPTNPFPEPVSEMFAVTETEQEKAEKTAAQARMASFTTSSKFGGMSKRFYSSDERKCKKMKETKSKKGCPKIVAPGCKPPTSISCLRAKQPVECTKKEAPYPSYSESCHEDLEMKPSECRLCPWKPEDNPNFKPPKAKFHTSTLQQAPLRKDDCEKPPGLLKEPCGWVKLEKEKKEKEKNKNKSQDKDNQKKAIAFFDEDPLTSAPGYLCDVRKAPCKKPPPGPCGQKKKEPPKKKPPKVKQEKCPDMIDNIIKKKKEQEKRTSANNTSVSQMLLNSTSPIAVLSQPGLLCNDEVKKGTCFRLPHDNCPPPKPRPSGSRGKNSGKCPPKPKKKKINDCPGKVDDTRKCSGILSGNMSCSALGVVDELATPSGMLCQGPGGKNDGEKKCPKVNLGICKDAGEESDDPCGRKRKGRSEICPGNLLGRYKNKKDKPKPKKASSAILPPGLTSIEAKSLTETRI